MHIAVTKEILHNWELAKINYFVLGGLENYPDRVGRDIDIYLPDKQNIVDALSSAKNILLKHGYRVIYPPNTWGKRLIGVRKTELGWDYYEIHIIDSIKWGGVNFTFFVNRKNVQTSEELNSWFLFIRKFMIPFLSGNLKKLEENIEHFSDIILEENLVNKLAKFSFHKCNEKLINFFKNFNKQNYVKTKYCKHTLIVKFLLHHPIFFFKSTTNWILKQYKAIKSPCSPLVYISVKDSSDTELKNFIDSANMPMFKHMAIDFKYVKKRSSIIDFKFLIENFKTRQSLGRQQLVVYIDPEHKVKPYYISQPDVYISIIHDYLKEIRINKKNGCETRVYNSPILKSKNIIIDAIVEAFISINHSSAP